MLEGYRSGRERGRVVGTDGDEAAIGSSKWRGRVVGAEWEWDEVIIGWFGIIFDLSVVDNNSVIQVLVST